MYVSLLISAKQNIYYQVHIGNCRFVEQTKAKELVIKPPWINDFRRCRVTHLFFVLAGQQGCHRHNLCKTENLIYFLNPNLNTALQENGNVLRLMIKTRNAYSMLKQHVSFPKDPQSCRSQWDKISWVVCFHFSESKEEKCWVR